jgi:hypothetical protein
MQLPALFYQNELSHILLMRGAITLPLMLTPLIVAICIKWIKTVIMCAKERLPIHLLISMVILLLVSTFTTSMARSQTDRNAGEDWFIDKTDAIIDAINEGELNFLDKLPDTQVHHHHNKFIVLKSSIETGWIKLAQCHENLDQFPRSQIVYNKGKIRHLRIIQQKNIGRAWVEDHTVQLTDVKNDASLCIEAESQALIAQKDSTFVLQNGPFMRKLLDGYFPMRVSIDIKLPANLSFIAIEPVEQKGFRVTRGKQSLHLDALFEGRLVTRIRFKLVPETKIPPKRP